MFIPFPEAWSNAMRLGSQAVSLPLSPKLTDSDVERVIDSVLTIIIDSCENK